MKRGSISETSPLLSDISGVMSWEKVNRGLLKMYQVVRENQCSFILNTEPDL